MRFASFIAFSVGLPSCLPNAKVAELPLTRGEFAEAVCFHLYDCSATPMSLAGGIDAPLNVANPVECVRAVRGGWRWLGEDGETRTLGEDSPDCENALDAVPCPMDNPDTYLDALDALLDECSL